MRSSFFRTNNTLYLYITGSQVIDIFYNKDKDENVWKLSEQDDPHNEFLAFFFVHSFAMLSTITNPILYGWLNTNLKHLFRAMIPTVRNERTEQDEELELMNLKAGKDGNDTSW